MVEKPETMDTVEDHAGKSQFLLNCTDFTQHQLESISLARGVSGGLSLLIASIFLSLLVTNRAFKSTLQRLFLYYVIILLLLEATMTVQVEHYFQYSGQEMVCKLVGFLSHYTACVLVAFINEIMMYLIYVSYYQLKGRETPQARSVCLQLSLEWILISIAIIMPAAFAWSPLVNGNYGLNGAVCEMKSTAVNCETVGFWDQVILAVFSYTGSLVIIVSTIVLVSMYCRMTFRYHHVQSQQSKKLLQHILLLSGLITIAFLLPVLLSLLYIAVGLTANKEVYAISLTNAIGTPFSLLLIPASFLVFVCTNKSSKVKQNGHCGCLRCCVKLFRQSSQVELSSVVADESITTSDDVSQSFQTEMSDIHDPNHGSEQQLLSEDSEEQPLVTSTRL